jgi:hypothetical protein
LAKGGCGDGQRHSCSQSRSIFDLSNGQLRSNYAHAKAGEKTTADSQLIDDVEPRRQKPASTLIQYQLMILRRTIFDAGVGTPALGRFALRHRIVCAFLTRSGFKAEVVMDVVARRLCKDTRTRYRTCGEDGCCDDSTHYLLHCYSTPAAQLALYAKVPVQTLVDGTLGRVTGRTATGLDASPLLRKRRLARKMQPFRGNGR